MRKKELKIDLVYLWVNGNDEQWQKEKLNWQKKMGIETGDEVNPCRFIDNEELRYSLRSIERNAPWINKIFIVTNGQVPSWLDTSHPKIKIITHDQIMPKDVLPTFNSNAISTSIINIPGLSEHFLYSNDDCFISKPVKPSFFFNEKGIPIIRLIKHHWSEEQINSRIYENNVVYSANLIAEKYGKYMAFTSIHNIMPFRKSNIRKCIAEFKEEFDNTMHCRFRAKNHLMFTIVHFYSIVNNLGILKLTKGNDVATVVNISTYNNMLSKVKKDNPYLFCLNDNENVLDDNRQRVKGFLSELFPGAQNWEKQKEFQIEPVFPDENSINLLFSLDDKFVKYFAVTLQSVIDHALPDKKYDIIVMESDITSKNKEKILKILPDNFKLRFIDITTYIHDNYPEFKMYTKRHWGISMFYRIFCPLIMRQYKKVLYLDSDMCVNYDVSGLFEMDDNGYEICAVVGTSTPILDKFPTIKKHMIDVLKLQNPRNYFNSGLIMWNIENIDKVSYDERFRAVCNTQGLLFPDQDILNMIFEGRVNLLHNKWNYIYGSCEWNPNYLNIISGEYKKKFMEARENPYIIHYTTARKPWNYPYGEFADIWWSYAQKTPFYEEILFNNLKTLGCNKPANRWFVHKNIIHFLNLPLIKIRRDPNSCRAYLFKVIPLYKITYRKDKTTFKLFNFIPLFKICSI